MVVNNPNNWHWVDKNCIDWSKNYFNEKLVNLSAEEDDKEVKVSSISSVEGDVEVCQRKGKVISLFDLKLVLNITGFSISKSGQLGAFDGSIIIPELAYDSSEDDLQFEVSIYNENSDNEEMRIFTKKYLVPKLRKVLGNFGIDLITTHSSDIQVSSDQVKSTFTKQNQELSNRPSTSTQPSKLKATSGTASALGASSSTPKPQSNSGVPKYNTTTLHLEPTFNTTAEELYKSLLDSDRISAWSRSAVKIDPYPAKEGSTFVMFSGSIAGKILTLVPNERIVQLWRLEDWKKDHYANMDILFSQGHGETKMIVKWSGVPIGEEERVRNNFEEYYVKSIKIVFGFGAVL